MLQLLPVSFETLALVAAAIAGYYAFSYAILYVVGRVLPLAGRRRRQ